MPRFLAEVRSPDRHRKVRIQYLYKTNVEDILFGLKATNSVNDWVLRHTKNDASFVRIAQMISCFGKIIERESKALGFEAMNMQHDFNRQINQLSQRFHV